jgi:hypothetical protein
VPRRELDAEDREHMVEGSVGEPQLLRVSLDPLDRDVLLLGPPA